MATSAAHVGSSSSTTNITFSGAVTVGNLILVGISFDTSSNTIVCTGCTDGLGNTYAPFPCQDPTSAQDLNVFVAPVTTGGSVGINFTFTGGTPSGAFRQQVATEFTGLPGLDNDKNNKTSHGSGTGPGADGMVSAAIVPSSDGQAILACGSTHSNVTMAAGTGFGETIDAGAGPVIQQEFLDQGTAASITGKWTLGGNSTFNAVILSFYNANPWVPETNADETVRIVRSTSMLR